MPAKENKISIKQFRDSSSNFWVDFIHYSLEEDGSIVFCAGGIDTEERREALKAYIKRNKKNYVPRETSIFEQEEVDWMTISFGKFAGKKVNEIDDLSYLRWLQKSTTDSKLKEQINLLLKK